jgi:subtilisin family serine protease
MNLPSSAQSSGGERRVEHRSPLMGNLYKTADETDPTSLVDVVIELNTRYPGGIEAARSAFLDLWKRVRPTPPTSPNEDAQPIQVSRHLYKVSLSRFLLDELISWDREDAARPPCVFRAWEDYLLYPGIDRSVKTVKADAAWRSFNAMGSRVVWAVIDSGIQADHQHFSGLEISGELVRQQTGQGAPAVLTGGLHRDFSGLVATSQLGPAGPESPLTDEFGHGSHVAGIIAGACPSGATPVVASSDEPSAGIGFVPRTPTGQLTGMAPNCELVSLKVMRRDNLGNWVTSWSTVLAALEYVRTEVNVSRSKMRIHGVNISLGCEWDPLHYAAGQSPLCQAVNELVASGVVVVISSGNGGSTVASDDAKQRISLMGTVTEPGHAEQAITVGSTHRDAPTIFGVSWRSGKGPTLDGRSKPDVVAPGEWITSVAVGTIRSAANLVKPDIDPTLTYAEQSGTSMAAPHVSGVIAAFLSNRPEYIGRPQEVKELVCRTATDLGRERYAQGAGLIDAMRMLSNS